VTTRLWDHGVAIVWIDRRDRERSVEESRGPMVKNEACPAGRANDREIHGHQGPGW
jgi:hypothetical protein